MQSRGIHHLDLVVSDIERSKRFYSELLRGLGWSGVLDLQGERGETIWYLQAQDTWIGLREKQSDAHPVPYDRYAVGVRLSSTTPTGSSWKSSTNRTEPRSPRHERMPALQESSRHRL
jgi:catechol 2,3-dioxygenase-like lactoylglutathione lyase family enzyme